jgi:Sec-independent protein secretion pathway component TatC
LISHSIELRCQLIWREASLFCFVCVCVYIYENLCVCVCVCFCVFFWLQEILSYVNLNALFNLDIIHMWVV